MKRKSTMPGNFYVYAAFVKIFGYGLERQHIGFIAVNDRLPGEPRDDG